MPRRTRAKSPAGLPTAWQRPCPRPRPSGGARRSSKLVDEDGARSHASLTLPGPPRASEEAVGQRLGTFKKRNKNTRSGHQEGHIAAQDRSKSSRLSARAIGHSRPRMDGGFHLCLSLARRVVRQHRLGADTFVLSGRYG